jgi:hypothetical protein
LIKKRKKKRQKITLREEYFFMNAVIIVRNIVKLFYIKIIEFKNNSIDKFHLKVKKKHAQKYQKRKNNEKNEIDTQLIEKML